MIGDQTLYTDPMHSGSYSCKIELPIIEKCFDEMQAIKQSVRSIYGYKSNSVAELVDFIHRIGHWSKATMIWMAESNVIKHFPVTADQIKKY